VSDAFIDIVVEDSSILPVLDTGDTALIGIDVVAVVVVGAI
jgi:hypothetical protein